MRVNQTIRTGLLGAGIALLGLLAGCGSKASRIKLQVITAGSLTKPFKQLKAIFEREHPAVQVMLEHRGSRLCARMIADTEKTYDVFGSADYMVVRSLLMPRFADFNIRFCTNELAIAYSPRSKGADRINAENWYRILLEDGVACGRSDPNSDPCGYRTVLTCRLAEKHYRVPGLAARLLAKDGKKYIRPKETDLLALLEAGEIDYLFIYRSVAEQHRLSTLLLPDRINLKCQEHADFYKAAKVTLSGRRDKPGKEGKAAGTIIRTGAPMVYSVTIPKNAPNRALAVEFVALLLSPAGRKIVSGLGQPCITPARCDQMDKLPASLQALCR